MHVTSGNCFMIAQDGIQSCFFALNFQLAHGAVLRAHTIPPYEGLDPVYNITCCITEVR